MPAVHYFGVAHARLRMNLPIGYAGARSYVDYLGTDAKQQQGIYGISNFSISTT